MIVAHVFMVKITSEKLLRVRSFLADFRLEDGGCSVKPQNRNSNLAFRYHLFVLSPELGRSDKEITKILDFAVGKANNQGPAVKSRLS